MKKTTEQFRNQVLHLGNGEYSLIGKYIHSREKVKLYHSTCGTTYKVTPHEFLKGTRCRVCMTKVTAEKNSMSYDEFYTSLPNCVVSAYDIDSNSYKNASSKLDVTCKKCGHSRAVRADALKHKLGCPECNKKVYRELYTLDTDTYRKRVLDITDGEYIVVSNYIDIKSHITLKHVTCGTEYTTYPYLFNKGRRCPRCNYSIGESYVRHYLTEIGYIFEEQVTFDNLQDDKKLSYDFYIPSKRVLIEYQGVQHYRPVELFGGKEVYEKQVIHDKLKLEYTNSNNYELICIPYTCNSLYKVESFLEDKL